MIGQVKSLLEHAEEYVETSVELTKLKAVNRTSETISYFVPMLVIIGAILLTMMMVLIGFSILKGHAPGKTEYGFFVVAAGMGVFCIVLYAYREPLLNNRFCDLLIKKILG